MSLGKISDLVEILQGLLEIYGDLPLYDANGISTSLPDCIRAGRHDDNFFIMIGTIKPEPQEKKVSTRMMSSTSGRGGGSHAGGGGLEEEYL